MHFDILAHTIFRTVAGSYAYGTNTPISDTDLRGICIAPRSLVLSAFQKFEQFEDKVGGDCVIYDLRKFVNLACECNPSLIELFFIDPKHWQIKTKWWLRLLENKHLFLSTKAQHTFSGYAHQQLKRMQTHIKWLEKAPQEPRPQDYNLTPELVMGNDEVQAYDFLEKEGGIKFSEEIIRLMSRVKGYRQALKDYRNFKEWQANRNPKRAAIEAEFGLDLKHASHLVRLTLYGEELLKSGAITMGDPQKIETIKAVRYGKWSFEEIMRFTEGIDKRLEECAHHSALPHDPDRNGADKLCMELMEDFWRT